jgi:hypothetical protein
MQNTRDVFARAYAMLMALRKNIEQMGPNISETYVQEYHAALDRIESTGVDVSEFRISNAQITPRTTVISTLSGPGYGSSQHSREKYADKPLMLTKIDALLGYLEISISEEPRTIGFRPPGISKS